MNRPFSLTMQAYRLDLDRLWLVLLVGSIFMALAWAGWAASDQLVVYETSTSVELSPKGTKHAANAQRRSFEAHFAMPARKRLAPGQKAVIFVQGKDGDRAIPALITEVRDGADRKDVRAILLVDIEQRTPDPFDHSPPRNARVAVGTRTPLDLWLPELAPSSRLPLNNEPQ